MFNGIIYNTGKVVSVEKTKKSALIGIISNITFKKKDLGSSICCNGVCLTLVKIDKKKIYFYLSNETLKRSKFRKIKTGDYINIEKPLKYGKTISGHIVQGHIDCIGEVNFVKRVDKSNIIDFKINPKERKHLIEKASIAINGVSLTISKKTKNGFQIWVIPHTLKLTNLSNIVQNDLVNVEIDILSKYTKKFINEKK